MAGLDLEGLVPLIHHQVQAGSGFAACVRHVWNSLLQGDCFTPDDISELTRNRQETRDQGGADIDHTGSLWEDGLNVWGLSLVPWRSEAMESDQNHPYTQLAFLLNRDQHWCPLRRFGHSAENCRWFKLDSDHPSPQWISKTDLGMFLQQAERDGYSIFVVVPIDPGGGLPRTDADDFASALGPEPSPASPASASLTFEGEDMELQAALQASLMCGGGGGESSGNAVNMSGSPPLIHSARTSSDLLPESTPSTTESQSCINGPSIPPNQDVDLRAAPESTASTTDSQSCRSGPSIPPNQVQLEGGNADVDQPIAQPSNVSVNGTGTETVAEENIVTSSEAPREVDVEEMRRRRLERFGDLDTIVRQRQRQTRKRPTLQAPKRSGRN
ncbi:hypothetical protein PAXINDRAFT_167081 [Paxillus involutus ATCC 200175]|nr:hypothetical protein PAXINDRAFT_167081 [Paxillus involutus ATCC 200175]